MKFVVAVIISCAMLCVTTPLSGVAQAKSAQNEKLKVTSANMAASLVKSKYGGKVLSAKGTRKGSGYNIKLLKDNGNIINVYVNAKTGKVSK